MGSKMAKMLDKEGLSEDEHRLREEYEEIYINIFKEHNRLPKFIKSKILEKLLEDENIDIFSVNHRIKHFDSIF